MTVSELRKALSRLPDEVPVLFSDDRGQFYNIEEALPDLVLRNSLPVSCVMLWSQAREDDEVAP